ncbi:MAG: riboflavin kinase [Gammaproteobacteria bacterium]|jgi:FAD synthase
MSYYKIFKKTKKIVKNYKLCGTVMKGLGEARKLGCPTANITTKKQPFSGIFTALVTLNGKKFPGLVFSGIRHSHDKKLVTEVHILNGFKKMIYGEKIEVVLKIKLRDNMKFFDKEGKFDLSALKNQIKKDIENANKYWKNSSFSVKNNHIISLNK